VSESKLDAVEPGDAIGREAPLIPIPFGEAEDPFFDEFEGAIRATEAIQRRDGVFITPHAYFHIAFAEQMGELFQRYGRRCGYLAITQLIGQIPSVDDLEDLWGRPRPSPANRSPSGVVSIAITSRPSSIAAGSAASVSTSSTSTP
jgi:hypothetical protein